MADSDGLSGAPPREAEVRRTAGADEATGTAFRFRVQQQFHEIPLALGVDEEVLDERMRDFARDYWGEGEELEPVRRMFAALHAANAQQLALEGVVYQALGIFPIGGTADGSQPPERISRCSLLVSVRELDNPNPELTAAGIAESLTRSDDGGETHLVTLPAGPAVVHVAGSRAVWDLPEGKQERYFVRIEVWLPFPDDDKVLLMTLSTADCEDLFRYQAVLADIAETVTFGDAEPDEAGQDTEAAVFG